MSSDSAEPDGRRNCSAPNRWLANALATASLSCAVVSTLIALGGAIMLAKVPMGIFGPIPTLCRLILLVGMMVAGLGLAFACWSANVADARPTPAISAAAANILLVMLPAVLIALSPWIASPYERQRVPGWYWRALVCSPGVFPPLGMIAGTIGLFWRGGSKAWAITVLAIAFGWAVLGGFLLLVACVMD